MLGEDPTAVFTITLGRLIQRGITMGIINDKLGDFLCISHPIMAVFHSLPKVHKGGFPPQMRPIVAGIGSLNERLCAWLDSHLQSLIPALPGYLRNSKQVLKSLEGREWKDGMMWITADVSALYSMIPHHLAIQALGWFLDKYSHYDIELKAYLLEVTEYLLTHNFFMFNEQHYLQTMGASMGAKFSPSIANIYMAWWETCFLFHDSNPLVSHISWYGCYIDDLLFIAVADVMAVQGFADYLNQNPCNLKFTIHHEEIAIPFLDLLLVADDGRVLSKSYRKSTAGNTVLHSKSCHPPHVGRNIPYGEMVRAKRNCSDAVDFKRESLEIRGRLSARGYPKWLLDQAHNKVAISDRNALLDDRPRNKVSKTRKKPIVFSTPYSEEYNHICKIINEYMPLLTNDVNIHTALQDGHRCVARRAPTLGQTLSPSLYVENTKKSTPTWLKYKGNFSCGHKKCICCNVLDPTNHIVSFANETSYSVNQYINCNSRNLIYLISCT